jgi:hypothetical protein
MPYKRIGRIVYHKKHGKWSIKQRAKSIKNAKTIMKILRGIEGGKK